MHGGTEGFVTGLPAGIGSRTGTGEDGAWARGRQAGQQAEGELCTPYLVLPTQRWLGSTGDSKIRLCWNFDTNRNRNLITDQ